MTRVIYLIATAAILSACTPDPEAAAARRAALIQQVFPDTADQQGIYLAFPLQGKAPTLELVFDPSEVSQATVLKRATKYCSRFGGAASIYRGPNSGSRTLDDGTTQDLTQLWIQCL